MQEIYLPDLVGGGYRDFWHFTGRYRVVKGGRASKKSKTAALNFIWRLVNMPETNLLVVRRTYRSLRNSCYAELCWAVQRLGLGAVWQCREEPLEMTYLPTGQKIFFRGLDDPQKITSIAAQQGQVCFLWLEEAFEVSREEDFAILDESIRGSAPFKQLTLTFNPWNERHWLKRRFFDAPASPDILAKTVDYRCNEFLDAADLRLFTNMARQNPRRYRVAGLGEWGVSEGLIFENWREADFDLAELRRQPHLRSIFGLDFGYVNDETALFCALADLTARRLWVFDEIYQRGLSNEQIFAEIQRRGYAKERICADSAEPKSIDRLRDLGLDRIKAARKGPDSIRHGIDFLQGFKIVAAPRCRNFLAEISAYCWQEDKSGRRLNVPVDCHNHLMDAMRYAAEDLARGSAFSFE